MGASGDPWLLQLIVAHRTLFAVLNGDIEYRLQAFLLLGRYLLDRRGGTMLLMKLSSSTEILL